MISKMHALVFRSKRDRKTSRSEAGFSLTEVLVAVFIIGLLSVVALGPVVRAMMTGKVGAVKKEFGILEGALVEYSSVMGEFPESLEDLYEVPSSARNAEMYPEDGFLQKRGLIIDPWGNEYVYIKDGEHGPFDLMSYGADGRAGGEDEDADIGNWQD